MSTSNRSRNVTSYLDCRWNKSDNALCNRYAGKIFVRMLQWDRDYFERVDSSDVRSRPICTPYFQDYASNHSATSAISTPAVDETVEVRRVKKGKRKGKPKWMPGPLYVVQIPVVMKHDRPYRGRNTYDEVAYFPSCSALDPVNLGASEGTRLLTSDLERIPNMPLPLRELGAPPGVNTSPGAGFRMIKQLKGRFRLTSLGHAQPHIVVDEDMYCPFCPGLKICSGKELWDHCREWDYRQDKFPKLCSQRQVVDHSLENNESEGYELQTRYLCGEIWDYRLMEQKYGLGPKDYPGYEVSRNCANAHRGFALYFRRRYREAYVAWQHARLVPGIRKYFENHKVGDCWELVNAHLRW